METSYQELKKKDVINLSDGKSLGKVSDVVFSFPEGKTLGIVVPGGTGWRFCRDEVFVDIRNVTKIGTDVVLVEIRPTEVCDDKKKNVESSRRDYSEYE